MKIKIEKLKSLTKTALTSKYSSSGEADKIIEVNLFAELSRKNTQGIKLKYVPKFVNETELSASYG